MSYRPTQDSDTKGASRASAAGVRGNTSAGEACPFCCLVLSLHPTLTGLTENDSRIFKAHLEKAHRLGPEIQR